MIHLAVVREVLELWMVCPRSQGRWEGYMSPGVSAHASPSPLHPSSRGSHGRSLVEGVVGSGLPGLPDAHTVTHITPRALWPRTMALVVHTGHSVLHPRGGGPVASPRASWNPHPIHLVGLKRVQRKLRLIPRHLGGENLICWDRRHWLWVAALRTPNPPTLTLPLWARLLSAIRARGPLNTDPSVLGWTPCFQWMPRPLALADTSHEPGLTVGRVRAHAPHCPRSQPTHHQGVGTRGWLWNRQAPPLPEPGRPPMPPSSPFPPSSPWPPGPQPIAFSCVFINFIPPPRDSWHLS